MELTLSTFEEHLYNLHLKISRLKNKQPYTLRKNFANIDESTCIYLKRISTLLKKHTHIVPEDFFSAPFTIYPDENYFDLQYFTTLKAVKSYTLFQKRIQSLTPDDDEQILRIQKSLKHILDFCREKDIMLLDYLNIKSESIPYFLLHLKEYYVNIYTLHGLDDFEKKFKAVDSEIIKFMFDEQIYEQIRTAKIKLLGSKKAIHLVTSGMQRISNILKKNS